MLKRIAIDGFRGIQSLNIEDCRRVNVFVGPNGGGKTSVLEALCVASQPFALQLLDTVNRWRDMPPLNPQTWHTLLTIFNEMDCHRTVLLEIETREGPASVTISALFGRGGTDESELVQGTTTTSDPGSISAGFEDSVRGIKSVYKPSCGEEVEAILELVATGYRQTVKAKGKHPPRGPVPGSFFIHTRRATSLGETAAALTDLYTKHAEELFISALKKVEPRIQRLIPGVQGKQPTVLADLGYATLVPISVLGDGFCRVSLIATGIVSAQRGRLLLVDEIDSGLHHTVMKGLWESILTLSREYDFQVFCSTHNEEMLRETLPAFASEPDALRVYRVSRNREGVVSQQMYDYEMFQDAFAMGMDVR
jgi:ABC-type molybdenum transport system ATPase subunit/photorepair protein PhrA